MEAVFVFSSQGAQWPGMGRDLYTQDEVFRNKVQECDDEIWRHQGWSIIEEMARDDASYRLHNDPGFVLPALTAVQIALCAYFASKGLQPAAVTGLSMGEVAAAHVAGILSLHDAIAVVCCQARLTARSLRPGGMAVVNLSPEKARAIAMNIHGLSVGVELSPSLSVLSGDAVAVRNAVAVLTEQRVFCMPVNICSAYHSAEVQPLEKEFKNCLRDLRPVRGRIPIYSSVSGGRETGARFDAHHWWQIMSRTAFFSSAVARLLIDGHESFVEVGPNILAEPIRETARAFGKEVRVRAAIWRLGTEEVLLDASY